MSEYLKNHIKISIALTIVYYFLSSYVFGTFNHGSVIPDDRSFSMILYILSMIIGNGIYHDSYKKENKKNEGL